MSAKIRESNFELLRLVAMMLVIVLHTQCYFHPAENGGISNNLQPCFTKEFILQISLVCANVFILISGWFGIKPKLKSILNLVFIILFWRLFGVIARGAPYSQVFAPVRGWFVGIYIGLLFISPILNGFVDSCYAKGPHTLGKYLLIFFGIEITVGILPIWSIFVKGCTLPSIALLYLLGRYMRLSAPSWTNWTPKKYVSIWLCTVFVATIARFGLSLAASNMSADAALTKLIDRALGMYTSPHVILMTVVFFLAFKQLHFSSRVINYLALSAFPMLFSHAIPQYRKLMEWIYSNYTGVGYLSVSLLTILCWMVATIALDQVRLLVWRLGASLIDSVETKLPSGLRKFPLRENRRAETTD